MKNEMKNLPQAVKKTVPVPFLAAGKKLVDNGAYDHFDFVRNSFTARFTYRKEGCWTTIKKKQNDRFFQMDCSCSTFLQHTSCPHVAALFFLVYYKNSHSDNLEYTISKHYEQSLWCSLGRISYEYYGDDGLEINVVKKDNNFVISGKNQENVKIFQFTIPRSFLSRIIQKYRWKFFDKFSDDQLPEDIFTENFENLQAEKTDLEIRMNESGYKSWLQKFEESYWFDFSKSWFFVFGEKKITVKYSNESRVLIIRCQESDFSFRILQNQIPQILKKLTKNESLSKLLNIKDEKVILNYSLKITDKLDLKITPVLIFPDREKPIMLSSRAKVKPVVFGNFLYFGNDGFYPFERKIDYFDKAIFNFEEVKIPNNKILKFINEYKKFIDLGEFYYVSPSIKNRNLKDRVKTVDVFVDKVEEDWLYLSVKYRIGEDTISLYDLYCAIRDNKRYLIGKDVWLDMNHQDFKWIQSFLTAKDENVQFFDDKAGAKLRIKKMNFIKLNAHLPIRSNIKTHQRFETVVQNLTQFKPISNVPDLSQCRYQLRDYQKNGFRWLWFLYENKLSGLLCDDMGLGKTYQSLALIDGILLANTRKMNFLIVCPTSVIPHWQDKLAQIKKKINLVLYYGTNRSLKSLKRYKYNVILTSYGIMRNDLDQLAEIDFELAVFDEIQIAKNKTSLTNAALNQLKSRMRMGLSGTPIENSLTELKALFDIILPDYLGGDYSFRKHYIIPIERYKDKEKTEELRKIISPFMLRRTKEQVLLELPPKIEEVRKCELSRDQIRLYKQVINTKARALISQLSNEDQTVPYMHIFAVLNYLKQICNHPAQLKNGELDYNKYQSGKWELFCELLEESLNSGFKVVVFSQYLNMLALIEQYLKENHIEFATIKGATVNRREMIDRFNNDPDCKVFTGSLRASGQGINLIGGSVVIHYDRWWNAAVEDQATDRVHRIGQIRGVQVFKLVTEGTLEEKIDKLIMKKRRLMEELIREDDANLVKHFSRDELIELLSFDIK